MNRPSLPPPANTLDILAADLLARRAQELIDALLSANLDPIRNNIVRLREALSTYAEVRGISTLRDASDPQAMQINEPPPATQRSVHHA